MKVFLTSNRERIGSFVERQLREYSHEVFGFDIATGGRVFDADAAVRAMVGCDGVAHLATLMGRIRFLPAALSALGTCWMRLKKRVSTELYPTAALMQWAHLWVNMSHIISHLPQSTHVNPVGRMTHKNMWVNRRVCCLRNARGFQ